MLIDVNEAALYYEERGYGAPLILIHGGLASSSQWEPISGPVQIAQRAAT